MSIQTDGLEQLLYLFIPEMLLLAIWIFGIIFALATWKHHPLISALVLVAMVLFIGQAVLGTVGWYWMMRQQANVPAPDELRKYLMNMSLVRSALQTIGWGIVLFAAFSGRQYIARFAPGSEVLPEGPSDPRILPPSLPTNAIRE